MKFFQNRATAAFRIQPRHRAGQRWGAFFLKSAGARLWPAWGSMYSPPRRHPHSARVLPCLRGFSEASGILRLIQVTPPLNRHPGTRTLFRLCLCGRCLPASSFPAISPKMAGRRRPGGLLWRNSILPFRDAGSGWRMRCPKVMPGLSAPPVKVWWRDFACPARCACASGRMYGLFSGAHSFHWNDTARPME